MKAMPTSLRMLLGCALALAACDILDTEPLGTLTDQTYDQNGLGWWNGFLQPDDNVQFRDPNGANDVFNWTATDANFAWVWGTAYKGIMRSNVVLDQLPKAAHFANPATKPRYE